MTTLRELTIAMRVYRDIVFNGPDSDAWQDFVMACIEELGEPPWSEAGQDNDLPADLADYWQAVAAGESADHDEATGARTE